MHRCMTILLLCFSAALVQADMKPPTDAPVKCRLRSVSSISTPCSSVVSFTIKAVPTSCSSQTASQITTPVVVSTPCQSSSVHVTTTGYLTTTRPFGMTSSSHGSSQSTPCSTSQKLTSSITTLQTSTASSSLPPRTSSSFTTQVIQSTSATVCSSCSNSRSSTSTTTSITSSTSTTTTTFSKELYSSPTPDAPMTRPPLRPPPQIPPSPGPPESPPPPSRRPPSNEPPSEDRPPSEPPSRNRPPNDNRPPTEPPSRNRPPSPPPPPTRPPSPPSPPPEASPPTDAPPPPPPRPPSSSTPKPPSPKPSFFKPNRKGGKGGTRGDSPLVFDMNKDGAVSASKNTGISKDPSKPNNQDGGAVGGDKMLAMSDLNGNGVVDIEEVFGDHTLSPFTKKPYHAANGFDALYMLALEMQSIPQCQFELVKKDHNSVLVSLTSVKRCLNLHNVQLGFISDTNISDLEELGDVNQVDVTDYINTPDDVRNGVLHSQKGSFYSHDGTQWKVDDVWFRK
ncbi:hypothetical protein MP228_004095 [Amoeboaphelidium protococcarum]|nr:hypothetical protein MP228_004095 [Amoeboaphelidium protococcarum]